MRKLPSTSLISSRSRAIWMTPPSCHGDVSIRYSVPSIASGLEADISHRQRRPAEDALRDRAVLGDELRGRGRLQLSGLRAALVPKPGPGPGHGRPPPGNRSLFAAVGRRDE